MNDIVYDFRDRFATFLCKMWLKWLMCVSCCLLLRVFTKTRYLSVLLCMEALVIVCVLILVQHTELLFRVCFISVGACGSSVGLACLVGLVRGEGAAYRSL